ncbi:MAG: 2-dehydro-3-deoxy-6-phosphogalactonate aldolase [Pusillimonas sp.]
MSLLYRQLSHCPFVAILRGITPAEVAPIGATLIDCGFTIIEVPLNSPDAFDSISVLSRRFADKIVVGAGTVLRTQEVERVAAAGGQLIVSPNSNPAVVAKAKSAGLMALPGFATPSEAFSMIDAGADGLKFFPAEAYSPSVLSAIRAVIPHNIPILPVGGIKENAIAAWGSAGASGFGLGSALYRPGDTPDQVRQRAQAFIAAWSHPPSMPQVDS